MGFSRVPLFKRGLYNNGSGLNKLPSRSIQNLNLDPLQENKVDQLGPNPILMES
jgi:hypothetical protein